MDLKNRILLLLCAGLLCPAPASADTDAAAADPISVFEGDSMPEGVVHTIDLPERPLKPDRPDAVAPTARPDRAERPQRPEHGDRPEKPERPDLPDRPSRPEVPDRPGRH